jgi:hypothetical protein
MALVALGATHADTVDRLVPGRTLCESDLAPSDLARPPKPARADLEPFQRMRSLYLWRS